MPTASEAWVQVIQEGKGYAQPSAAQFRRLINQTRKNYAFFKALARHVPARGRVLEAGCGWACSSFALAGQGVSVVALDISEKLIGELERVREELGAPVRDRLTLVAGDIFKLAELGEKFDVIFNDGTYEHFLDSNERREILRSIRGQLKPDGKYLVAVPNTANLFFGAVVDAKMPAMHPFRLETLAEELEAGGFRVVERGYQFVNAGFEQWLKARWMAYPVRAVNGAFAYFPCFLKKFLAAHVYCVAQKTGDPRA